MSLQFDWDSLKPYLDMKIKEFIAKLPKSVHPVFESQITLKYIDLGTVPPSVILTNIYSLTKSEQVISAEISYDGNIELEVLVDINANTLGAQEDHNIGMKMMGTVYCNVPLYAHCRFLLSKINLFFKVKVTHSDKIFMEFEEPPKVSLDIDSNLCKLGILFKRALRRVERFISKEFSKLPQKIEINYNKKLI